jgi:hypothetical protein
MKFDEKNHTLTLEKGEWLTIVFPGETLNVELTQDTASIVCPDGMVAYSSDMECGGPVSNQWKRITPPVLKKGQEEA